MSYLVLFAEITFLIEGLLFPILFVLCCRYIYIGLNTPGTKKKNFSNNDDQSPTSTINLGDEVLKPLTCNSCGGVLLLDSQTKNCNHCGATTTIPPHYTQIFKLREEASQRLNNAGVYLLKANRFRSPFLRYLFLFLTFWTIAVLPLLIYGSVEKMTTFSDNLIKTLGVVGDKFYTLSWFSWLMWVVILFFSYAIFDSKTLKKIPVLESDTSLLSKEENVDCVQCGANLHFKAKDIGCFCNYCGTETYRVKFSSLLYNKANEIRKKANFSLIEAMEAYKEAIDDIISTPSMLIFILIILPFIFFVLPYLLWEFLTNHWLLGILLGVIILAVVIYWKPKKETKQT